MNQFISVAREGSLPEGGAIAVAVGDRLIALFRDQGRYLAITDVCPHMGASLAEGHVAQGVVTCPWHAWRFRLADGTWCDNPTIKIEAYPVRVVDGEIQICVDTARQKSQRDTACQQDAARQERATPQEGAAGQENTA